MRYRRLLIAILLLASVAIAQSVYVAPTIPPLFTSTDILNSAVLFQNLQAAYNALTVPVLQHDKDLYSPTGTIGNLSSTVNGMIKPLTPIPLNTCAPVPPLILNANQQPVAVTTYGNLGGWKMGWISDPTLEMISCPITVAKTGYYYVIVAAVTPTGGHQLHVEMPAGVNVSGEIAIPNTGSWTSIFAQARSPLPIPLVAGGNTLIVNFEGKGYDVGGVAIQPQ
jgi:hypothetical protein